MDRVNSLGIPRDSLGWALRQPRIVRLARRQDACLLCCAKGVNEAGLCTACTSLLRDDELALAERWMSGIGP
jgi:hypothetical protein